MPSMGDSYQEWAGPNMPKFRHLSLSRSLAIGLAAGLIAAAFEKILHQVEVPSSNAMLAALASPAGHQLGIIAAS